MILPVEEEDPNAILDYPIEVDPQATEPSGSLLEALKMYYGTQAPQTPAPPEEPMQMRARAMPNQARDPQADRREKTRIKAMMQNSGPKGPPKGQDNFSDPMPTAQDRSRVSGAMMLPPVERRPSNEQMGDPDGLIPEGLTRGQFTGEEQLPPGYDSMGYPGGEEAQSGYGLDLSPMEDTNVQPMADIPQSQSSPRSGDDPREALKAYLSRQQASGQPSGMDSKNAALIEALRDTSKQNSDLGYMNLLMNSMNMAGTVAGKSPSTAGYDRFTQGQQNQNRETAGMMSKLAVDKQKQQDDRLKGMMFLAKQKQDEERYASDLAHRGDQLRQAGELGRERIKSSERNADEMQKFREMQLTGQLMGQQGQYALGKQRIELDRDKLDYQKGRPGAEKPVKLPLDKEREVVKKADANAARSGFITKMKASLEQYRNAKTPKEKKDFGLTLLKDLNSEQNPDAIGAEESKRFGGNLEAVRLSDIFVGENPFGANFKAFDDLVSGKIKAAEKTHKETQEQLDSLMGRQSSAAPTPAPSGPGVSAETPPAPGMKWQVNKKTGAKRQVPISQ